MDNVLEFQIRAASTQGTTALNDVATNAGRAGEAVKGAGAAAAEAAASHAKLGEAAGGASGFLVRITATAEAARESMRRMGERALEAGAEIKESMAESTESLVRVAEAARLAEGHFSFFAAGTAALGGFALVGLIGEAEEHIKEVIIELNHMSEATGVSLGDLASLGQAMQEVGASSDSLGRSVIRFDRAVQETESGNKKMYENLKALGITSKDFMTALSQFAAHLAESKTPVEDNAHAMQVFGRNILELKGYLKSVGTDFDAMIAQHKQYAETLTAAKAPALELQRIEAQLGEQWKIFAAETLPYLVSIVKGATSAWVFFKAGAEAAGMAMGALIAIVQADAPVLIGTLQSASLAAASFGAAMAGNIPLAADLGKRAAQSFKDLPGNAQSAKDQISAIWSGLTADIAKLGDQEVATMERIWAKAGPSEESTEKQGDIQFKVGAEKLLKQQEEILDAKEKHALALIELEKQSAESEQKLHQIGYAQLRDAMLRAETEELAVRKSFIAQKEALYKNDPDSIDKVAALEGQKTAALDKATKERAAIVAKYSEDVMKWSEEIASQNTEFLNKQTEEEDARTKKAQLAYAHLADEQAVSASKAAQSAIEAQQKILEEQEKHAIAKTKEPGGGGILREIEITQQYEARIIELTKKLEALKVAEAEAQDAAAQRKFIEENPGSIPPIVTTKTGEAQAAQAAALAAQVQKTADQVTALMDKMTADMEKAFTKMFANINSQFSKAAGQWASGAESFSKAFAKIPREMLADMVSSLVMQTAKFIEQHTIMLAAQATFHRISEALAALHQEIMAMIDAKGRLSAAKTAAANVYKSISAIPVVGPFLAPPAAAAAFATVLAFEQGGIMPNAESLAVLHPREMVLPAPISQTIQNMAAAGAGGGGFNTNNGGHTFNINYHGYQGQTQDSMRMDANTIKKHIRTLSRENRL